MPQLPVFNYKVSNAADTKTVDIHIDGDIVDASSQSIIEQWFGDETTTSFKSFRNQVEDIKPQNINVWINSPGGSPIEALAIHDYLNQKISEGAKVTTTGTGLVASAATQVLMGANSGMTENSFFLIHNISMDVAGDINFVENFVAGARKVNDRLRDFYSNETGISPEEITNMMNKETLLTAAEAKRLGFVKNVVGTSKKLSNQTVLSLYNSFKNTKKEDMSIESITAAITSGFDNLMNKMFPDAVEANKSNPDIQNALKEFSDGITNAIAEMKPEPIEPGLNEEAVKNLITESLKNYVTSTDLTATKDTIINSVADNMGKGGLNTETPTPAPQNNGVTNKRFPFKNEYVNN